MTDCLKSGSRLVIDTHLLVRAARQEQRDEDGPERRLIAGVIGVCARVVFSPDQARESRPHLRAAGLPPMPQIRLFQRLEEADKLRNVNASRMEATAKTLDADVLRRLFTGNLDDDPHLYLAAAAHDRIVITEDAGLLRARKQIHAKTGVLTLSLSEALAEQGPSDGD
ncbi:MAG: hypothetical protein HY906_11615 [Deltaproteobacteria bacterium]|nr:hypothetical protein [Deltaproteobacteria bacterium]